MRSLLNWRLWMSLVAIAMVIGTLWLSSYLTQKISATETQRLEQWVHAIQDAANPNVLQTDLSAKVLTENNADIPIIFANEKDSIIDTYNLDSTALKKQPGYLQKKLQELKAENKPIVWVNPMNAKEKNLVYYGESKLLKLIKYFPIVQLLLSALFIGLIIYAINTANKSTQNLVWAGMAKEAAHQLGTPITSLEGWIEILKDSHPQDEIPLEMQKDIDRLKLVSDRFGKIGSTPALTIHNIPVQVEKMVEYIRRRAPEKIVFTTHATDTDIQALINAPLFDWVLENLLKNALDAMSGTGKIDVFISEKNNEVVVDVCDTGKGMPKALANQIFKPGYTTKRRGWGLGLTLSKRIIEEYHKGSLSIKHSEPGKGTTFRIILNK